MENGYRGYHDAAYRGQPLEKNSLDIVIFFGDLDILHAEEQAGECENNNESYVH